MFIDLFNYEYNPYNGRSISDRDTARRRRLIGAIGCAQRRTPAGRGFRCVRADGRPTPKGVAVQTRALPKPLTRSVLLMLGRANYACVRAEGVYVACFLTCAHLLAGWVNSGW